MNLIRYLGLVEEVVRNALPSIVLFRVRPGNDGLCFAFSDEDDFAVAVMAAGGANIRVEVASTFEGKSEHRRGVQSCVVILDLERQCVDARLVYFMYEILGMKQTSGGISPDVCEFEKGRVAEYQSWFDQRDSAS